MLKRNRRVSVSWLLHGLCILERSLCLLSLTIDNRFAHPPNDCYSRVSIGAKLPDTDVPLQNDPVSSFTECQENCSKHGNACVAFSFGVGAKGNVSCLIGARLPPIHYFQIHPEYDVYVKHRGSLWCHLDRLYGSTARESADAPTLPDANKISENGPFPQPVSMTRWSTPISAPRYALTSFSHEKHPVVSGAYSRQSLGIVSAKKETTTPPTRSFADDSCVSSSPAEPPRAFRVRPKTCRAKRWRRRPATDCLRRTHPGKRMTKLFVERIVDCENVQDCCRSCDHESSFVCSGFNHRTDDSRCLCELTSTPYSRMNVDDHFSDDSRSDYYEKSQRCLPYQWHDAQSGGQVHRNAWPSDERSDNDAIGDKQRYGESFGPASARDTSNWNRGWKGYDTVPSRREYHDRGSEENARIHEQVYEDRCAVKALSGTRLNRRILRKTYAARDSRECERLCAGEASFLCQSFSYRQGILSTRPTDNCLLSDHSHRDFNFYTDLEPDRDYDIHVMMRDAEACRSGQATTRHASEECFSRIRSGYTIPPVMTRTSLVANDFGECQFACTSSEEYFCRCFVYKFATHARDHFNCFLTDWPVDQIDPVDMPDMDGAEFYERITFSYGCDAPALPMPYPSVDDDRLCYTEHHIPCKLTSRAVLSSTRAVTKSECREKCSAMRNTGSIPCMSFDYAADATTASVEPDHARDNCFLSDVSVRDLRPNLDYVHDRDHTLYTWTDYDPRCSFKAFHATYENRDQPIWQPLSELSNDGATYPVYSSITGDTAPPLRSPDLYQSSVVRRYTVNGQPCKNGTLCRRNQITGFWSCETETEPGAWDYCCEPNHPCGYSKGYRYPWCHVGADENQWRPCSDTYYPHYVSDERPPYRESSTHVARHWPIIHFHGTSPPNCSDNDP